jgi:hypothetical protein
MPGVIIINVENNEASRSEARLGNSRREQITIKKMICEGAIYGKYFYIFLIWECRRSDVPIAEAAKASWEKAYAK